MKTLRLRLSGGLVVGVKAIVGLCRAESADLALEISGVFGPTTQLNGTAFGEETPFSFHAVFDSTHDVFHKPGAGIFPVTQFTITIAGHGTFAGIANIDLNAVVVDPSYHLGVYAAGLVDFTATSFFLNKYSAVSPPFNPPAPTPTTFLDYFGRDVGEFPYIIPLAGGAGNLAINDFADRAPTASIVAVPESSPSLAATLAVLALVAGRTICNPDRPR